MKAKNMKRFAGAAICGCATTFAFPAFAFAAEGESEGIGAILPNMTEFIPMLIAFIIVAIVLWKLGWPMFDKMLAKRENTIKEALEKSEAARIESERVLAEYKQQLEKARQEANAIVAEAKQMGERVRADITSQAQSEAENIIAKAREAVAAEKKSAIAELQGSVADLTVQVATRVIGQDFSDDDHRKLIERSIEEVGKLNA